MNQISILHALTSLRSLLYDAYAWQAAPPPIAFQLHVLETTPSTNAVVATLASQGAAAGTVVMAKQQSSGRGQWGRQWQSPVGGLYLSLLLKPQWAAQEGGQLTLCTTWGVAIALRTMGIPVQLKWPNDLVIQRRKLGGLLIETRLKQGMIHDAIVGIGVNWHNPVPATGINLAEWFADQPPDAPTRPIPDLETLAAVVLHGLMAGYQLWQQQGIDAILPSYQTLLTRIGTPVQVGDRPATILGVAANGELRVAFNDAETLLPLGSVQLGYAPEASPTQET
jgi:BirA family biotin operon repressor/biotin-[acetyl-CoA-carboxylase] ligase